MLEAIVTMSLDKTKLGLSSQKPVERLYRARGLVEKAYTNMPCRSALSRANLRGSWWAISPTDKSRCSFARANSLPSTSARYDRIPNAQCLVLTSGRIRTTRNMRRTRNSATTLRSQRYILSPRKSVRQVGVCLSESAIQELLRRRRVR
jgi:hypothetical protein